jgi:hypothetical protein
MAQNPETNLTFVDGCSDCAVRKIQLPERAPEMGDDFDWLVRDYDGFRLFMMEELAARFPERRRWTPADMEVVIVEALSVILDQLSDQLDRTRAEAFLETARRPDSVRRLLAMIGYDAVGQAGEAVKIPVGDAPTSETTEEQMARLLRFLPALRSLLGDYRESLDELTPLQQSELNSFIADGADAATINLNSVQRFLDNTPEFVERARNQALNRYWAAYPHVMDSARDAGPRTIHTQKRMVTEDDYAERMEDHPLVLQGHAFSRWSGSWSTIYCAVIIANNIPLDSPLTAAALADEERLSMLQDDVDTFYQAREIEAPDWSSEPTPRTVMRPYLDAYRMAAQEIFLLDAEPVGINISLAVRIDENYFQSEVRHEVLERLGSGLDGFFEPGRLQFGEDLHSSDIIEAVMALDGVKVVCLNRFKRVGKRYPNQADAGRIQLDGLEVALCDNNPQEAARGILNITLHGGRRG